MGGEAAPEAMAPDTSAGELNLSPFEREQYQRIYGAVPSTEAQLSALTRNSDSVARAGAAPGLMPAPAISPNDKTVSDEQASQSEAASAMGVPQLAEPGQPAQAPESEAVQKTAQTTPAAPAAPGLKISTGPNLGKELSAANKEGEEAQNQQARTAQAEAAAILQAQQAAEANRVAATQEWNTKWQQNQARADAMARMIENSEIDPNRLYHNMSTGQRLGTAFAMILSGIGSGMTMGRQQNLAVEAMNKAIDQDIDAQKANLGKKQSLLNYYVSQGHDIQSAAQLAKADARDAAAAQLQMVGTKFMGQRALDVAGANIATLHKQAALERQQAFSQGLDNTLKAYQVAQVKQQMQMAPMLRQVTTAAENGAVIPAEGAALLDPKRRVKVPGGWTLANTEKDRDEVAEINQTLSAMRSAIKTVRELSKEKGAGGSTTQEGQLAIVELQNAYQALLGRKNAPRGPQEEQLAKALSNPTTFWKTSAGINKLMNQMENIAKKHAAAAYAARLVGGLQAARGLVQEPEG